MRILPCSDRNESFRWVRICLCFVSIALVLHPVEAQPIPFNLELLTDTTYAGKGIRYSHIGSKGSGERKALSIHVLRVDLTRIHVRHVLAIDQVLGQEPPTSMVQRYDAVAGINGGFSVTNDPWQTFHGDPNGFFVLDGDVVSQSVEPRATFGLCSDGDQAQAQRIFKPTVEITVTRPDGEHLQVAGLNRAREVDDSVVYTPIWGRSTITNQAGIEVVVSDGRVQRVVTSGSARIPGQGFVLSASGSEAQAWIESLRPGHPLNLAITVYDLDRPGEPVSMEGCSFSSAGPRLVRDGVPVETYEEEEFGDHFTFVRHPRTALGVDASGRNLLVFVVDGRQPALSVGMTLPEMAQLMAAMGAVEGYNLDGGGSSIMVIGDHIMNSPSDGRERRRSDGIVFVEKRP